MDASITSPFLELFGRPTRNEGYESERNNLPSASQKLYLLNSAEFMDKVTSSQTYDHVRPFPDGSATRSRDHG